MKHHLCIGLGMLCLLTACGDKTEEVKAPPPKIEKESSLDSVLGNASPATEPKPPVTSKSLTSVGPPVTPPQPIDPNFDRNVAWLQKLQRGTPAEKQAVQLEIARAGLSPKEREEFEKLKAHYGVKE